MEIRKLEAAEQRDFHKICQSVFFDIGREEFNTPEIDDVVRLGAFGADGKLQSALMVIPYVMRMNGRDVKMGGLGAVVSKPEARGRGQMPALMKAAFADMREKGQIFSFLYPFSFVYYRKFGYEMCYAHNQMKIPLAQISSYKCCVDAMPVNSANDALRLKKIYEHFTRDRNLAIVRGDDTWEKIAERDAERDLEFTYFFRDTDGSDVAYIMYGVERDDDEGNRLIIQELCWVTPDALRSVLGFLARLGPEFEYIIWNAPPGIDVLFPEAFDVERRIETTGMNRIVDVTAALATLHAPDGNGRVVIGVTDDFLPENSGTYAVEWNSGALCAEKTSDVISAPSEPSAPDMLTSVQTLAQLVTGYITPEIAALKKDTATNGATAELNALFQKRHLFIIEHF